jgi:membrane-associated protein
MHEAFFITSVEHFSYVAIFFFAIFAGYLIPLPEEIILLIVGYMASVRLIHLTPAIFVVIIALIIGDNILFTLARKNNKHVHRLVNEVLSLKIMKNRELMKKHIGKTVFLSRFFPFLRFVGPIFAGYVKASESVFQFYNTSAIIIYTPLVIGIGFYFNNYFNYIVGNIEKVRHIGVILVWIIVGLIITRVVDYIFRKVNPDEE